ncbi:MAG: carboxypeptidase regulatory-like domain-containing protein, partial [Sedimentisphaerales bacterium]|nr:carboxypeptidase regulatory-like domain-containing protein [Sedimentisphaerales bacterium]
MAGRCRMSAILAGWLIGGSLINVTLAAEYLLGGRVYEGVPWEQDKPIPGVTVELWGAYDSGVPIQYIAGTATDAQGWYGLLLDTGDWAYDYYIIWEKNPAGYVSTDARTVGGTRLSADQIQFGWPLDGVDLTGNKFWDKPEGQPPANRPPVADADGPYTGQVAQPVTFDGSGSYDPDAGDSIVSYEWDLDNDGQYDDATGVTVQHTWSAAGSGTVGLRVTDSFGDSGVDSSTYTIEEGPQAGGTIRGTKFDDLNGNGVRDAGEPGLAGWQITLEDDDGNALATATTNANGDYEFGSLEPGAYRVDEVQQAGWRQTYPEVDGQPAFWAVGVEPGGTINEVDFGNTRDDSPPGPEYEEEHGDAPQPYVDFYLSVSETVFLGRYVDGETVMQRDPQALGDDHNDGNDDED